MSGARPGARPHGPAARTSGWVESLQAPSGGKSTRPGQMRTEQTPSWGAVAVGLEPRSEARSGVTAGRKALEVCSCAAVSVSLSREPASSVEGPPRPSVLPTAAGEPRSWRWAVEDVAVCPGFLTRGLWVTVQPERGAWCSFPRWSRHDEKSRPGEVRCAWAPCV